MIVQVLAIALAAIAADEVSGAVKDASITARIETTFLFNEHLNPFNINTTTEGGVVTLTGSVNNEVQKDLAADVAKSVEGVKDVHNDLTVVDSAPPSPSPARTWRQRVVDESINASVRTRLLYHKHFRGLRISVRSINGVVTLSGIVPTEAHKSEIGAIVFETKGVVEAVNNLSVNAKEPADQVQNIGRQFSDEWVEKRVEANILLNRHLSVHEISAEVDDGVCFLTGTVGTEVERELAGSIADSIQGVRAVRNDVRVRTLGEAAPLADPEAALLEPLSEPTSPAPSAPPAEPGALPKVESAPLEP